MTSAWYWSVADLQSEHNRRVIFIQAQMAGFVVQLRFLSKLKRNQQTKYKVHFKTILPNLFLIRPFEDDKGALSGAIHSAVMDNTLPRLKLLIEVRNYQICSIYIRFAFRLDSLLMCGITTVSHHYIWHAPSKLLS